MKKTTLDRIQPFALFCIILINILPLFYVHPLSQNLSDLGNILAHKELLILWGGSAALYFYLYTTAYIKKSKYPYPKTRYLLCFSCILMVISVCIPYHPESLPQLAKWHTRLAMLGTGSYVLIMFHILTSLLKSDYTSFTKYFPPYTLLVTFDLLLFLLNGGVSTLLEISFTIGMSIYLYYLAKPIK